MGRQGGLVNRHIKMCLLFLFQWMGVSVWQGRRGYMTSQGCSLGKYLFLGRRSKNRYFFTHVGVLFLGTGHNCRCNCNCSKNRTQHIQWKRYALRSAAGNTDRRTSCRFIFLSNCTYDVIKRKNLTPTPPLEKVSVEMGRQGGLVNRHIKMCLLFLFSVNGG